MSIYINSKGEEKDTHDMDDNYLLNAYKKAVILEREGVKFTMPTANGDGVPIAEQIENLKDEILLRMDY